MDGNGEVLTVETARTESSRDQSFRELGGGCLARVGMLTVKRALPGQLVRNWRVGLLTIPTG